MSRGVKREQRPYKKGDCVCGRPRGHHRYGDQACPNPRWVTGNGEPQWASIAKYTPVADSVEAIWPPAASNQNDRGATP